MQTLVLVVSRFQVSVVNRQYEKSRWSLVAAAVLLMIHYGLQMACGFRAHSDDAGTIVNILFYTPATFLVAHSILNLECEKASAPSLRPVVWHIACGHIRCIWQRVAEAQQSVHAL